MWSDEATFMSAADVKMKDRPPTPILKGFMAVVYSCTQQNYKKRCTMEEVGTSLYM